MADPFSVVAGTAGLADVCVRLTHFLKRARDGSREVDRELKELFEEIGLLQSELESLELINNSVKDSYVNEAETRLDSQYRRVLETHWRATQNTLASCQSTAEQIEALLQDVAETGSGKHLKLDQIVKWVETKSGKSLRVDQLLRWMKQQSKGDALRALREKLKAHQIALQVSLSAVNL